MVSGTGGIGCCGKSRGADGDEGGPNWWGIPGTGRLILLSPHLWGHQPVEGTGPTGTRVPTVVHSEMPSGIVSRPKYSLALQPYSKCSCGVARQGDGEFLVLALTQRVFKPDPLVVPWWCLVSWYSMTCWTR